MPEGSKGVIEFIALSGQDVKTLETLQVTIGNAISKSQSSIVVEGNPVLISDTLANKVLVRLEE